MRTIFNLKMPAWFLLNTSWFSPRRRQVGACLEQIFKGYKYYHLDSVLRHQSCYASATQPMRRRGMGIDRGFGCHSKAGEGNKSGIAVLKASESAFLVAW